MDLETPRLCRVGRFCIMPSLAPVHVLTRKHIMTCSAVNQRLDAISEIHSATSNLALSKLRELLKSLPDLERGLSRVHFGRAGPNELLRVLEALTRVGSVFDELGHDGGSTDFGLKSELLRSTARELPKIKRTVRELVDQVNQKMARDGRKENLFEREQDWPELVVSFHLSLSLSRVMLTEFRLATGMQAGKNTR